MNAAEGPRMEFPSEGQQQPRRLRPAQSSGDQTAHERRRAGSSGGPTDAGRIVDALKASADTELTIAERLSSKARQAFALATGVFVVAQTVAFGNFETGNLSGREKDWMLGLAISAAALLAVAAFTTLKADATFDSRDLPLSKLEDDLNAAYDGDPDVLGRLGGYYLGVVRTRRKANASRKNWYIRARVFVILAVAATVAELVLSLAARTS